MSGKLRLLISESYDPWFNLAVEECIFRQMPADQRVLFLWRNDNTVVIGRAQNPWKECNTRKMDEDGVKLARRSSGGGAVFHDLGNTILDGLSKAGIQATASGRNDLVVPQEEGERKISGSAYKETKDRGFHHGTLLINANLSRLANYLNPDPKKLQAKGITSVRSRVTNLVELKTDITHEKLCETITESFFEYYGERVDAEIISPQKLPDLPGFEEIFAKQSSWEWNFGQAPAFSHLLDNRFKWGGVELHFDIERGNVVRSKIYTDSLDPAPLEALSDMLVGQRYTPASLNVLIEQLITRYPSNKMELKELQEWLVTAIA